MKITIVCDVLGEENNGTSVAAMNLIRYLTEKGHELTVVCPDEDRRSQPQYAVVPQMHFGPFDSYVKKVGVSIAKPNKEILERAVCGADVLHLVTPFFLAGHALEIARREGIPITASFHCQAENISSHLFLLNSKRVNRSIYHILYRRIYAKCDAIHFPTQFICDVFESTVGVTTNHYVISNAVNARFVSQPTQKPQELRDKFVILFTGRYCREKSHTVLIDGVALSRHEKDIALIFAGTGPLGDDLRRHAKKLTNMPVFRFFSREEMLRVLNYADLYVHPAEIEIEAIACLEAIACGLVPVISDSPRSATGAFALDERNLFRCNDPLSLAERIDYWIEHPDAREQCRQAYLGYAAKFDQNACMVQMEQMLIDTAMRRAPAVSEDSASKA